MNLINEFDKALCVLDQEKALAKQTFERGVAGLTIEDWQARVKSCCSVPEVMDLLSSFREHNWTPQQQALMSATYLRKLKLLAG